MHAPVDSLRAVGPLDICNGGVRTAGFAGENASFTHVLMPGYYLAIQVISAFRGKLVRNEIKKFRDVRGKDPMKIRTKFFFGMASIY
jgi:hypothetical protein